MNKAIVGIVIAIVAIAVGAYIISRGPASVNTNSAITPTNEQSAGNPSGNEAATKPVNKVNAAQGHAVFSISDAAANMTNVDEVTLRISKVEVHSATRGWVTVSSAPKNYDLLRLNDIRQTQLLVDAALKAGTYNQVRLKVDSVTVKAKSGASVAAKMPSTVLTINTKIVMSTNKITSINFDFMADKSLFTTAKGEYVFLPVIKADSRSGANVQIDASDNTVDILGGDSDSATDIGMDVNGSLKLNFQIDPNQELTIDANGIIKIAPPLQ